MGKIRNRSDSRLADLGMTPEPELTPADLCPPGEAHSEEDTIHLGGNDRVFVRRRWWGWRLIEFAIVRSWLIDGDWVIVIRADTCHGEVHLHVMDVNGDERRREVIRRITDVASIEKGYDECSDRIFGDLDLDVRQRDDI